MPKKEISGEELKIDFSPEAQAQIDADPELAAEVRHLMATMRQAQQGVHDGKYSSFEEGMAALGSAPISTFEIDGEE